MAKKKNATRADGLIAVQVYIGMVDSKRKYKTVYGHTQKEADEKANEVKIALGKGIDVTAQRNSFGEWLDKLMSLKKHEVSPTWYNGMKSSIKHFAPLNGIEIGKLKSYDFQTLLYDLADKGLSQKTLKTIKSIALQVFQLAIDNRILEYNPVVSIKVPRIESKCERRALTEDERTWIIETPHRAQTAAMIMLFAGLRRGEVIPLTWSDINLSEKTININKSVQMISGQSIVKIGGKTTCAVRTVHIPQILADYLSTAKHENLLVCLSAKGKMLSEIAFKRLWESYLNELNRKYGDFSNYIGGISNSKFAPKKCPIVIANITPHWLRHSFATMLYLAGVDVLTAKEQLGHADVKTTLGIYTHLDTIHKVKNMSKLDDYLSLQKVDASIMQVN